MAYQSSESAPGRAWRARLGRDEPPPAPTAVRAGEVTAILDGIDLRYVSLGGTELVRRVHVAVRDTEWGTVPGRVRRRELRSTATGFRAEFEVEHERDGLRFAWAGRVEGLEDGTILYRADGAAGSRFAYNRIGVCVLLPPETWAERDLTATGPDGTRAERLPAAIAPQLLRDGVELPVLEPFERLALSLPEAEVELAFSGDLWEVEDQRNWSDASFKAYSTPLRLGVPHRLEVGDRIAQTLRIGVTGPPPRCATPPRPAAVRLTPAAAGVVPALGILDEGSPLGDDALAALRRLRPRHLRRDLRVGEADAAAQLRRAVARATELGARLELALHLGEEDGDRAAELLAAVPPLQLARVLAFDAAAREGQVNETTPPGLVDTVRGAARAAGVAVAVGGGTTFAFNELNRAAADLSGFDVLAFPLCPTVHADDERSVIETVSVQPDLVAAARRRAPRAAVAVTPIRLGAPGRPDPRLGSLFAAAWTLASAAALGGGGAASASFFATSGGEGVVAEGRAVPAYHVLADLADLAEHPGARLRPLVPSRPFAAAGALLGEGDRELALLANLTPEPLRLRLPWGSGNAGLRLLDADSSERAAEDATGFRRGSRRLRADGELELELGPYAYARVDRA